MNSAEFDPQIQAGAVLTNAANDIGCDLRRR